MKTHFENIFPPGLLCIPIAASKMANTDNAADVSDTEDEQEWTTPEGKNSFVWDHFKLNKDKSHVKCDHCDMVFKFSSATSTFSRHLGNKHEIRPGKRSKEQESSSQSTLEDAFARYMSPLKRRI